MYKFIKKSNKNKFKINESILNKKSIYKNKYKHKLLISKLKKNI